MVDLGYQGLVAIVHHLLGGKMKDVLDLLGQHALEGKPESVVVLACLIGLLFKLSDKGGKVLLRPHLEVEEVLFGLYDGVKDIKPAKELLYKGHLLRQHRVVGVKPEEACIVVKDQALQV